MAGLNEKWSAEKLDGSNWTTWKFQMRHLLRAKGLWQVVEGTEVQPEEAQAAAEFQKKSEKALATIVLGISTSKLYLTTSCECPKNAWNVLKQHFERDSLANKLFLKKQYFRMEMRDRTLIEDRLKQMKELTDKLAAVGAPISEEDQVVTLLGSLPTSYSALVTALEAQSDGDISLSYVQQALIHEEQKRNGQSYGSKGETALFGASNKKKFQYKKKVKCFNCKRFGHYIKNCPSFIKPDSSGPGYKAKVVEAEESAFHGVSGPSVKHPLEHQWVIDSDASNHMTRARMLLADFKELDSPEKDGIGDGRTVDAVGVGNVKVKMDLQSKEAKSAVLYGVLYVPISGIPPTRIPPSGMTPFHHLLFLLYFMRT